MSRFAELMATGGKSRLDFVSSSSTLPARRSGVAVDE